jgi:hypothetical protein
MRSGVFAGIAVSMLAAVLTLSPAAGATSPNAATAPVRKVALGVSMRQYDQLPVLDAFTKSVGGHTPAVWSIWRNWGDETRAFPSTALLNGLRARHAVPMVIWQPVDGRDATRTAFTYRHIIKGEFDTYIRGWAKAAKAWGGRMIIRFAHEMDGRWFPWGVGNLGNTPDSFVKAWRHIWNIFRGPHGVGANNVRFLWSPLSPAKGAGVYPGNAYVDYVGMTALNWGGTGWRTLYDVVRQRVLEAQKFTTRPIIVAEAGSSRVGGDKAAWIRNGYPAVYRNLPSVKAIVYFNIDMRQPDGQPDWRLTSPPAALAAYAGLLGVAHFQGRLP